MCRCYLTGRPFCLPCRIEHELAWPLVGGPAALASLVAATVGARPPGRRPTDLEVPPAPGAFPPRRHASPAPPR